MHTKNSRSLSLMREELGESSSRPIDVHVNNQNLGLGSKLAFLGRDDYVIPNLALAAELAAIDDQLEASWRTWGRG